MIDFVHMVVPFFSVPVFAGTINIIFKPDYDDSFRADIRRVACVLALAVNFLLVAAVPEDSVLFAAMGLGQYLLFTGGTVGDELTGMLILGFYTLIGAALIGTGWSVSKASKKNSG